MSARKLVRMKFKNYSIDKLLEFRKRNDRTLKTGVKIALEEYIEEKQLKQAVKFANSEYSIHDYEMDLLDHSLSMTGIHSKILSAFYSAVDLAGLQQGSIVHFIYQETFIMQKRDDYADTLCWNTKKGFHIGTENQVKG